LSHSYANLPIPNTKSPESKLYPNNEGFITNVDVLIPSVTKLTIADFSIKFPFAKKLKLSTLVAGNPAGEDNLSNNYIINVGGDNSIIYTDNVLNLLNRSTPIVIPTGKLENTFVKSQNSLKSEPGYLVPKGVEGNINYQTFLTGLSNEFEIASGVNNLDYETKLEIENHKNILKHLANYYYAF
jgi:hypothetical protein